MQDIDFDEIDRAVSSVTNPGRTVDAAPVPAAEPEISSHAAPSLAARRSSGRFMDVVHPSSDMRPHAPAEINFNRQETVPIERTEVAERPAVAERSEAEVTTDTSETIPTAFHWPDPIDMAEPVVLAAPVFTPAEPVAVTPVVSDEDLFATSLESPFLTNTKVEKRPLGAFSYPESDLPLIEDFADQPVTSAVATETDPEAVAVDAVEELEAVEVTLPDEIAQIAPEAPTVSVAGQDDEVLLLKADNEEIETPPVGPTSITQQYKEHPSTDAQPSGAIYDTEAYHQPLAHPAKKHSSLLVIVWILGLIIVGGAIGAAMYFFVLPLL